MTIERSIFLKLPFFGQYASLLNLWRSNQNGDNKVYARFIILTTARTGSTWLQHLLRKHPQVISYGEVFHNDAIWMGQPVGSFSKAKILRLWRDMDPIHFMDKYIYRGYNESIKAVGMKIFFKHLERNKLRPLKNGLDADKNCKVIFLTRRNLLKAYVSKLMAHKSGKWNSAEGERDRSITLHVDVNNLIGQFKATENLADKYRSMFASHPLLELDYETLSSNTEETLQGVFNFIGVEDILVEAKLKKQENRPLGDIIENYQQVATVLSQTRWAWMCG